MSDVAKYRPKAVIEAVRWDGTAEGATLIVDWILDGGGTAYYHAPDEGGDRLTDRLTFLVVGVPMGSMEVAGGDWIIRGAQGAHYPCKPDFFAATYEPVRP